MKTIDNENLDQLKTICSLAGRYYSAKVVSMEISNYHNIRQLSIDFYHGGFMSIVLTPDSSTQILIKTKEAIHSSVFIYLIYIHFPETNTLIKLESDSRLFGANDKSIVPDSAQEQKIRWTISDYYLKMAGPL